MNWRLLLTDLWAWISRRFRRTGTFTLIIKSPFAGPEVIKRVEVTGKTLFHYLQQGKNWKGVARAKSAGKSLGDGWLFHIPRAGERIELEPATGVKSFTEGYIARLNAEQGGGKFLKAIIVTENRVGPVLRYFVDHEAPIVFDGNTYNPLDMAWQDFEIGLEMSLPSMKVIVPNIGGEVVDYVETIDILENDVVLQVLHIDLLGDTSAKDEILLQIQSIEGDDMVAAFSLGLNLGFKDNLPPEVILKSEFPGLTESTTRFRV